MGFSIIWWPVLFMHFIADFMLQPKELAFNKKRFDLFGWFTAIVHCIIYTVMILIVLWYYRLDILISDCLLIFLSHFIIDKFPIIEKILKIFNVRSWDTFLSKNCAGEIRMNEISTQERTIHVAFGAIVFVVCDSIFHLVFLYTIVNNMYLRGVG